jgi:hypothetical protein
LTGCRKRCDHTIGANFIVRRYDEARRDLLALVGAAGIDDDLIKSPDES